MAAEDATTKTAEAEGRTGMGIRKEAGSGCGGGGMISGKLAGFLTRGRGFGIGGQVGQLGSEGKMPLKLGMDRGISSRATRPAKKLPSTATANTP